MLLRPADSYGVRCSGGLQAAGRAEARLYTLRHSFVNNLAPKLPRPGPEVDGVICAADDRRIVLDDNHSVAGILQSAQHGQQTLTVARVQADGRLVDDIHRFGQRAAQRSGQVDALRFTAGESSRLPIERQVREADFIEVHEAIHDLAAQMPSDRLFLLRHREVFPEMPRGFDIHRKEIADCAIAKLDVIGRRFEPRAMTLRARLVAAVLRELHANVNLVLLRFQPFEEALDAVPLPSPVVQQVPFARRQLADRHIESQVVFLRSALEILVAILVAGRVPRRDRKLIEPEAAVWNHLLHVDADDPAVTLAVRARAERRVE